MQFEELIDKDRMPGHVAIIMDGNGRWARAKGLERTQGHAKGTEVARQTIEDAVHLGIKYITLYTFSMENWKRPQAEIEKLMTLLFDNIEEELFIKNNVRFRMIGDTTMLSQGLQDSLNALAERTAGNTRSTLILALCYSSRWEITRAVQKIAGEVSNGEIGINDITETTISEHLETSFMPDPDLIIRTGGESRLSNFLMWQASYSELYYTDVFWPDFNKEELCKAIYDYQQRERRFGKTSAQVEQDKGINK